MKKFLNKLDIERAALKPVNKQFGEPQLCGLTTSAVNVWHSGHPECDGDVYNAILTVSESIAALSERSGERFDEQYAAVSARSSEAVDTLSELLIRNSIK